MAAAALRAEVGRAERSRESPAGRLVDHVIAGHADHQHICLHLAHEFRNGLVRVACDVVLHHRLQLCDIIVDVEARIRGVRLCDQLIERIDRHLVDKILRRVCRQ